MVRTALYQAAHVLMHHGRWSGLRGWAMRIAKRSGAKLAKVALARKLAVILHRMWINETNSAGPSVSQRRLQPPAEAARKKSRSAGTRVCPGLRSLPSTSVTRPHWYYEPLHHPRAPGLSLAGVRLVIADRA